MTRSTISISDQDLRNAGKQMASGALGEAARLFLLTLIVVVLVNLGVAVAGRLLGAGPLDDTDRVFGLSSGLRPRTDALTGCEYLEVRGGGITPRMGADGRQVCRP